MAVMIFNPTTLEQREVIEADADRAVNENGWVRAGGANELLAVYHPGHATHKVVLKRDYPVWEQKGYYAGPTILYSPTDGETMVSADQAEKMLGKGWYATPADFPTAEAQALANKATKAAKEA